MSDIFSVKNKVIIITGGAGVLGQHYAKALKKAGARVITWDKKKVAGGEVVDITNESQVQEAVAKIFKKYKKIDALINNAALNLAVEDPLAKKASVPYEEYPLELWEQELKVNLTGAMICTKHVAAVMIKQQSGSIINIGSDIAILAHDHRVYNDAENRRYKSIAYAATKAGLLGFTRQWAARLGQVNVRVNAFSPTGTSAPGQPVDFVARYAGANMFGRMAEAREYLGPIIFLCSDASSFMTGHNLIVDGGRTAW